MNKILRYTVLLLVCLMIPVTASAYNMTSYDNVKYKVNGWQAVAYGGAEFDVTLDDTFNTYSYCVQVGVTIGQGIYYADLYRLNTVNEIRSAYLLDTYGPVNTHGAFTGQGGYSGASNAETISALQFATWYLWNSLPGGFNINNYSTNIKSMYNQFIIEDYGTFDASTYAFADTYSGSATHRIDNQNHIVRTPVPEPGTILLLSLGLLGIGILRRKQ